MGLCKYSDNMDENLMEIGHIVDKIHGLIHSDAKLEKLLV